MEDRKDCKGCYYTQVPPFDAPCFKCSRAFPPNYSHYSDFYKLIEIEESKDIEKDVKILLCKINKVTAYHRHGNPIPKEALDDLANFQIEFEDKYKL